MDSNEIFRKSCYWHNKQRVKLKIDGNAPIAGRCTCFELHNMLECYRLHRLQEIPRFSWFGMLLKIDSLMLSKRTEEEGKGSCRILRRVGGN